MPATNPGNHDNDNNHHHQDGSPFQRLSSSWHNAPESLSQQQQQQHQAPSFVGVTTTLPQPQPQPQPPQHVPFSSSLVAAAGTSMALASPPTPAAALEPFYHHNVYPPHQEDNPLPAQPQQNPQPAVVGRETASTAPTVANNTASNNHSNSNHNNATSTTVVRIVPVSMGRGKSLARTTVPTTTASRDHASTTNTPAAPAPAGTPPPDTAMTAVRQSPSGLAPPPTCRPNNRTSRTMKPGGKKRGIKVGTKITTNKTLYDWNLACRTWMRLLAEQEQHASNNHHKTNKKPQKKWTHKAFLESAYSGDKFCGSLSEQQCFGRYLARYKQEEEAESWGGKEPWIHSPTGSTRTTIAETTATMTGATERGSSSSLYDDNKTGWNHHMTTKFRKRRRPKRFGDIETALFTCLNARVRAFQTLRCGLSWNALQHLALQLAHALGYNQQDNHHQSTVITRTMTTPPQAQTDQEEDARHSSTPTTTTTTNQKTKAKPSFQASTGWLSDALRHYGQVYAATVPRTAVTPTTTTAPQDPGLFTPAQVEAQVQEVIRQWTTKQQPSSSSSSLHPDDDTNHHPAVFATPCHPSGTTRPTPMVHPLGTVANEQDLSRQEVSGHLQALQRFVQQQEPQPQGPNHRTVPPHLSLLMQQVVHEFQAWNDDPDDRMTMMNRQQQQQP